MSVLVYLWINGRDEKRAGGAAAGDVASRRFQARARESVPRADCASGGAAQRRQHDRRVIVARLLTDQVNELAAADASFDKQAYIGAFTGDYQFWVNVLAFLLQAFVSSRLVKHRGLGGALLALPLVALGGYAIVAAGVGLSVVRWVKTAENATDYSIMNTARQLLWLPTNREEKYKAKQAIDASSCEAAICSRPS